MTVNSKRRKKWKLFWKDIVIDTKDKKKILNTNLALIEKKTVNLILDND